MHAAVSPDLSLSIANSGWRIIEAAAGFVNSTHRPVWGNRH
jgi:hypothetical protein